jgi:hypothetical protein
MRAFEPAGEIPSAAEEAPKDPEDMSFAHAVSGNSLHNFVLEDLFVYNEIRCR